MRFSLQLSLPLTFWNLNEYKAEDHAWPTEFLYEMCSEIFFKISGVMSNLFKCTNQLFGAAQPIVMYQQDVKARKPELNTPLPFVRGWMHMFWGVGSQQVPAYVHTLSVQIWFYLFFCNSCGKGRLTDPLHLDPKCVL